MNERIIIDQQASKINITIRAFKDKWKQSLLMMWIILFSLCGLAIFSQFFLDYDAQTKIFFGVYIAFWLFFEFKVIYAYRWRSHGLEYVSIEDTMLLLTKQIGKRGVTQAYKVSEIKNLRLMEDVHGYFLKSMTDSYWNINKYTLIFDVANQQVPFAIDLTKKDAQRLLKILEPYLSKQIKD